jgi:hypothetical protein
MLSQKTPTEYIEQGVMSIPLQVQEAADFIMSHRHYLPVDHPLIVNAQAIVRGAGYWSASELAEPPCSPPEVTMVMTGMVDANGRRRINYRIDADRIEIGTATHWLDRETYPWCLHLPAPDWHRTCHTREDVLTIVGRFVQPWE